MNHTEPPLLTGTERAEFDQLERTIRHGRLAIKEIPFPIHAPPTSEPRKVQGAAEHRAANRAPDRAPISLTAGRSSARSSPEED